MKVRNANDDGWIEVGGDVPILQQDAEPATTYPGQLWLATAGDSSPRKGSFWEYQESIVQESGTLDETIIVAGNTYDRYMFALNHFEDLRDNGFHRLRARYNGDDTANYDELGHIYGLAHADYNNAGVDNLFLTGVVTGGFCSGEGKIFSAGSGKLRQSRWFTYRWDDDGGFEYSHTWRNTADELVSIQFYTDDSVKIDMDIYRWVRT
jgi:hypothetical protein